MNEKLIKQLIDKKAIIINSELEIENQSNNQTITVTKIHEDKIFGYNQFDGHFYKIPTEIIKRVNGMDIPRITQLFNINLDGTIKAPLKRRGRKRKNV